MKLLDTTRIFIQDIYGHRSILRDLIKRDFRQEYLGSYLGIVWIFLQPLLFVSMLYFIISMGLKASQSTDMPFSIYLLSGIVAWMYFSKNLSTNTHVIERYSFMVKKINFNLSILPIVGLVSSSVQHVFLLALTIAVAWYNGFPPTLYTFQLFYYFLSMFILLLGVAWLTSSCNLFIKDVTNIVTVVVQFGFWLTPIFWHLERIPPRFQWLVELNPMVYVITGYRDSIALKVGFWERENTLYFWLFTLTLLYVGSLVYGKLRPHFAEVV